MLKKVLVRILVRICALTVVLLYGCGEEKEDSDIPASPSGDLVINEVVAKSSTPDFLAGNDWIELYNSSNIAIHLSSYSLADSDSEQLSLPSVSLLPGQYIVIAAVDKDDDNPPSPSVPFKLGSADSVSLYKNGVLASRLTWSDGQAPEGGSFGLLNGIASPTKPTPNALNIASDHSLQKDIVRGSPSGNTPLRISEVVAQSDRPAFYGGEDWVELVNVSNSTVNLSEFSLTDSSNPLEKLPNISIAPGAYVVVVAGGTQPNDGVPHLSFGLGREDSLSLFRGDEEVDYVSWIKEQSKNGRSYGRISNTADWEELYPTPSESNVQYVLFDRNQVFTARISIDTATWDTMVSSKQEVYYPADFELNGAKISNVGFRLKGQGSLMSVPKGSKRFGFKVDMNQYEDKKFMGMKKLVFNQSFSDPSFMRDVLAYDLLRDAGVPSPEITFVDLYVAGEHLGLYQMVEPIDTEFLERHFPEDKDDQGDLHKGELLQPLTLNGTTYASYKTGLPLKNNSDTEGTSAEGAAIVRFIQDINSGDASLARSRVDIDLTIKYIAASVLTGNLDNPLGATANNFYLYEQRSKGTFATIPWDYNLGFGMWGNGPAKSLAGFGGGGNFGGGNFGGGNFGGGAPNPEPTVPDTSLEECRIVNHVIDNPVHDANPERPMLDVVLKNAQLRENYRAELKRLIDTVYNAEAIRVKVNDLADLIDTYVQNDPTKYFTYEEFRLSLEQGLPAGSDISGGRGAGIYGPAPGLVTFVTEKSESILKQLSGQLPASNSGGAVGSCPIGTY